MPPKNDNDTPKPQRSGLAGALAKADGTAPQDEPETVDGAQVLSDLSGVPVEQVREDFERAKAAKGNPEKSEGEPAPAPDATEPESAPYPPAGPELEGSTDSDRLGELELQVNQIGAAVMQMSTAVSALLKQQATTTAAAAAAPRGETLRGTARVTKAARKVKLIWIGELYKKGEGNEMIRLEEHTCYQASPAIVFKPFAEDAEDPRPHALVDEPFAQWLQDNMVDRATGVPQYVLASDPEAPSPRRWAAATRTQIGRAHV